jgi:cobyrinic acid a,c-diamide synthase
MPAVPRIVVAGTHSGCGKTTVSVGLMSALGRKGVRVSPFKVGPDFIDPLFHSLATGIPSRNLDTWLMGVEAVRNCFLENSTGDLSVIEGVMGLFDGASPKNDRGSTAEVARLLRAPVILVVDGEGVAGSAAAIVKGFCELDRRLKVGGIIFERVWGKGHYEVLRDAVKRIRGVSVLGYVEPAPSLKVPERHLGLVPPEQFRMSRSWVSAAGQAVSRTVDLDAVLKLAHKAPGLRRARAQPPPPPRVKIGIARDEAFNFYYADNLDLLRAAGADLVPFSPLHDEELPQVNALIFGGGFPESYAERLSRNGRMISAVRSMIRSGGPVYAECGGLMYLAEELIDAAGRRHPMVGIVPGRIRIGSHLQNFGYARAVPTRDTFLLRQGERLRGHEFHHSSWSGEGLVESSLFQVHHRGQDSRLEGFCLPNLHASYVHLHWRRHGRIPKRLVTAAAGWAGS